MVLVDFYADWCAPCKTLEAEIIQLPSIKSALRDYVTVRVDTDRFPEVSRSYGVAVMPTLLILDATGEERARIAGMIGPEGLLEHLRRLAPARRASPGAVIER